MERNFKIQETKLLAVEGKDECNFFESLLKYERKIGIQVVDVGGKDKFPNELSLLTKLAGYRSLTHLGFVRDAENLPASCAFDSICEVLRKNELPVPDSIIAFADGKPRTGIFIMPNNLSEGMLENLCLKTLEDQKINICINEYMQCIDRNMEPSEKQKFNESKSRVLSYLASKSPITNSLGLSAQKGYWDFSHNCFDEIKKFLNSLF